MKHGLNKIKKKITVTKKIIFYLLVEEMNNASETWKELWPELFDIMNQAQLGHTIVTLSETEANDETGHITPQSLDKFATKACPSPIIFLDITNQEKEEKRDVSFVIRYCDAKNAKEQDIDPNAKSFMTVTIVGIPHVGIELMITRSNPVRRPEGGFTIQQSRDVNVDGSVYIKSVITDLLLGKTEGLTVK